MKEISYSEGIQRFTECLSDGGALMCVKDAQGNENVLTIGWAFMGNSWGKPCVTVLIRQSRHSYPMLESTGVFTVNVPAKGELKEALKICGTKSGRDGDKFQMAGITAQPGRKVDCPFVAECRLQFECRVVYKQDMIPNMLDPAIDASGYAQKDYHRMYYAQIVGAYEA